MRALVTGAGGFVGGYLTRHLLERGDQVLGAFYLDPPPGLKFPAEKFDILDLQASRNVISRFKPDVIYHLAGIAFVPEAEEDFQKALLANVLGTSNIYRTCHLLDAGIKVVYISSAEVYGKIDPKQLPINERTPVSPANNYSLSKNMAEMVAGRYAAAGSVKSVIIRPFNHIGPGQDVRFVTSNFATQLARIAKGQVAPVMRVGNLEALRDFSDVRDIVRAYRLAAEKGEGIYNLCSGKPVAIKTLLSTLLEISGLTVQITEDPARMRPAEVPEIYGSYQKAKVELGWQPQIDLKDTLREIYQDCLGRI